MAQQPQGSPEWKPKKQPYYVSWDTLFFRGRHVAEHVDASQRLFHGYAHQWAASEAQAMRIVCEKLKKLHAMPGLFVAGMDAYVDVTIFPKYAEPSSTEEPAPSDRQYSLFPGTPKI